MHFAVIIQIGLHFEAFATLKSKVIKIIVKELVMVMGQLIKASERDLSNKQGSNVIKEQ